MSAEAAQAPASYRGLLGNREITGLLSARAVTGLGDQIARLALAVFVLERSQRAVEAALVFAVSYLPAIVGSAFLGSLADRFPRRTVILACDLSRAGLLGILALLATQSASLVALLGLLLVAELFSPPSLAARSALLPDASRSPGELSVATGVSSVIDQLAQVVGLLVGAVAVGLFTARAALAVDALAFLAAFVITAATVRVRPAPSAAGTSVRRLFTDLAAGARQVFGSPARRALVVFGWGAAPMLFAAETVALPYAQQAGASAAAGALLLAATPLGAAVGAVMVGRLPLGRQLRLMLPLAAASTVPLLATAVSPPVPVAAVLWLLSGLCQGYMVTIFTAVALFTATEMRGRVAGIAGSGFNLLVSLSFLGIGALADAQSPTVAVVTGGALGLAFVAVMRVLWPTAAVNRMLRTSIGASSRVVG